MTFIHSFVFFRNLYCINIWPFSNTKLTDYVLYLPLFSNQLHPGLALTATTIGIPSNMTIYFFPCFFSLLTFWSHFLTVNLYEWFLCNTLFFVTTIDYYYERFLILDVKNFFFLNFGIFFPPYIWWSVI